ncbi:cyclase family protein, partial [Candidatus Bipolaricaulota bacterium]|nr:cyclase family protein [Candidatus Bipolaricaulota bacterium]
MSYSIDIEPERAPTGAFSLIGFILGGIMQIIDLSLKMKNGSLSYPGTAPGIVLEQVDIGFPGCTVSRFTHFDVHCGTHFDAPFHFVPGADDVAVTPLILPEIVFISTSESPLSLDVLKSAPSLEGKAILFSTGWEDRAGTKEFFEGFPVLSEALAKHLVAQNAALVGLDSPSVDVSVGDYPVHRLLLGAGIPIVEGLVNLRSLLPHLEAGKTVRLTAFPLRIQGLEGSPVRAVAL